jgi:hypothetical protein
MRRMTEQHGESNPEPAATASPAARLIRLDRTEFFSDGVLAIALTLLALDLSVSGYPEHGLGSELLKRWPSYAAFFSSFVYIAVMWVNHHRIFDGLKAANTALMWANFGILLGAVVLPFPTAVLAEAFISGAVDDQHAALLLYSLMATLMGTSWTAVFIVILRHPELWRNPDSRPIWHVALKRSLPGAGAYVVAAGLGLTVSPVLGLVIVLAVPIFYAVTSF